MIGRWVAARFAGMLVRWLGRYLDAENAGLRHKLRKSEAEKAELREEKRRILGDFDTLDYTYGVAVVARLKALRERDEAREAAVEKVAKAEAERDRFRVAAEVRAGELQELRDASADLRAEYDDYRTKTQCELDRMGVRLAYVLEKLDERERAESMDGQART